MKFRQPIFVLFVILKVIAVECHYLPPSELIDPNAFACNGDRNATLVECPLTCMLTCYNALDTPGPCLRDCTGPGCECHPGFVLDVRALKCVLPKDCSDPPVTSCRADEVFALCAGCPRTCQTLREYPPKCEFPCAWHACVCAQGLVRDAFGRCIPPDLCPHGIPPGSSNPCGTNEEYSQCGTACPVTCSNIEAGFPDCAPYCMAGCTCQHGYVRNSQNRCVLPSSCEVPPKCEPLEVWSLCAGCPVTCALLRLPPALRPKCVKPCITRGCVCEPGLARSDTGECVLPAMCYDFAKTSHLENTNGGKKNFNHHVIHNSESIINSKIEPHSIEPEMVTFSEDENNNGEKKREMKQENVQHADFARKLAHDFSLEQNAPIISVAEPKPESIEKEMIHKNEKEERSEDKVYHSDGSDLDNRESLFQTVELQIPTNIDISDTQEDPIADIQFDIETQTLSHESETKEKEQDKIWPSSLPEKNTTHSETENVGESTTADVQNVDETIFSEHHDSLTDSDVVWNFSSPNDVHVDSSIIEENTTHSNTSNESHSTADNVQHADLTIFSEHHDSLTDSDIVWNFSSPNDVQLNSSIIKENTTHSNTSNESHSTNDNVQHAELTSFSEHHDSLTDSDIIWSFSSPIDVHVNSSIIEENTSNSNTSNEGHSTEDNVQHADLTIFEKEHDSTPDNSPDILVDDSVIPDTKINDDTKDETLIDAELISPLFENSGETQKKECYWGSKLGRSKTRSEGSEDSGEEINQQESNDQHTYIGNYENIYQSSTTDRNEDTREGSPVSHEQIVFVPPGSDRNQAGDSELNADNVQHAGQTNLSNQHDIEVDEDDSILRFGIDNTEQIVERIDESTNDTEYEQNDDSENDDTTTHTTPTNDDSNPDYVSPNVDDIMTSFDDITLCAHDSKICCDCCDNTKSTSIEFCELQEENSDLSSIDSYLPDRVGGVEDQDDEPHHSNPKTVENTSYGGDWQKEETTRKFEADSLHYSEQPVSCNGDPNALPGCGNFCGRTCNDYYIEDLQCSNLTCRVGACDCKDGFVLDVNSNKCVSPDDCTECGSNEYLDHCPSDCHVTCPIDTKEEAQPCPKETDCPDPACVCMFNYRRDSNDECIPIQQCPNLQCKGAHEYYEPCPPDHYSDKCQTPNHHPRHQPGPSRYIHECRPACLCADGYCRNIYGYCVSKVDHC